jgi:hypothetical protein
MAVRAGPEGRQRVAHGARRYERISQPVILSEAKDLALPMEVADGEGTPSEILRFAQNDSECIFLPFADFFTPSKPWGRAASPFTSGRVGEEVIP